MVFNLESNYFIPLTTSRLSFELLLGGGGTLISAPGRSSMMMAISHNSQCETSCSYTLSEVSVVQGVYLPLLCRERTPLHTWRAGCSTTEVYALQYCLFCVEECKYIESAIMKYTSIQGLIS